MPGVTARQIEPCDQLEDVIFSRSLLPAQQAEYGNRWSGRWKYGNWQRGLLTDEQQELGKMPVLAALFESGNRWNSGWKIGNWRRGVLTEKQFVVVHSEASINDNTLDPREAATAIMIARSGIAEDTGAAVNVTARSTSRAAHAVILAAMDVVLAKQETSAVIAEIAESQDETDRTYLAHKSIAEILSLADNESALMQAVATANEMLPTTEHVSAIYSTLAVQFENRASTEMSWANQIALADVAEAGALQDPSEGLIVILCFKTSQIDASDHTDVLQWFGGLEHAISRAADDLKASMFTAVLPMHEVVLTEDELIAYLLGRSARKEQVYAYTRAWSARTRNVARVDLSSPTEKQAANYHVACISLNDLLIQDRGSAWSRRHAGIDELLPIFEESTRVLVLFQAGISEKQDLSSIQLSSGNSTAAVVEALIPCEAPLVVLVTSSVIQDRAVPTEQVQVWSLHPDNVHEMSHAISLIGVVQYLIAKGRADTSSDDMANVHGLYTAQEGSVSSMQDMATALAAVWNELAEQLILSDQVHYRFGTHVGVCDKLYPAIDISGTGLYVCRSIEILPALESNIVNLQTMTHTLERLHGVSDEMSVRSAQLAVLYELEELASRTGVFHMTPTTVIEKLHPQDFYFVLGRMNNEDGINRVFKVIRARRLFKVS